MKYCINCGAPMEESSAFCSACGTSAAAVPVQRAAQPVYQQPVQQVYQPQVYQQPGYVVPVQQPAAPSTKNGFGIAGFVLSLIGLVLSFFPVIGLFGLFLLIPGFILSVVGFIIGIVKKKRIGLAIAGTILAFCAFGVMFGVYGSINRVGIYY